jgi:hypothetical protein
MFNLEQSIMDWRRQMLSAGIKSPVPLKELEIHLREEIEQQMELGLNEQKAFEVSIQQVGQPKELQTEFKKVHETYMNIKLKSLGIIAAFGAIIAGVLLQAFTDSFISLHHDGAHGAIIFHWPVFLVVMLHFAGLVCLAWPMPRQSSNGNAI